MDTLPAKPMSTVRKSIASAGLVCAMLLLSLGTGDNWAQNTAVPVVVAEASAGLAFSESDVDAYSVPLREQFLDARGTRMERGCATLCAEMERVWAQLQPVVRVQRSQLQALPRLEVVLSKDVDALAFAEGTVVVSEAFVSRLVLEDAELAFVLAHEVAHILLQHERQTLTSAMALMPGPGVRSVADCYSEMGEHYFMLEAYFSLIAQQTELEADEVGLHMAALAGFDPRWQLAFMEKLARTEHVQSMVSTHPDPALRLNKLREALPLAQRLFEAVRPAR